MARPNLQWSLRAACAATAVAGAVLGHLAGLSWTSQAVLFVALALIFSFIPIPIPNGMTRDPYGTFHVALNVTDDAQRRTGPPTEWLNMGYWKVWSSDRVVRRA